MFTPSGHLIRKNKTQLSSSNLIQFDFITQELDQAGNDGGVLL